MTDTDKHTSRIPGFYRYPIEERLSRLKHSARLSDEAQKHLITGGGLDLESAERMTENVIAIHGLPLSVALNFRVNNRDVLVPMAVEEPSVVAAASNAARLIRTGGGFTGQADEAIMTAQVQFDDVPAPEEAKSRIEAASARILKAGDASIGNIVARGGGCRDLEVRILSEEEGILVVHIYIGVGKAMGANIVDTVAEATAGALHDLCGGTIGLRILSNLPLRRMVHVQAQLSEDAVGGARLAAGIAKASRFAELDPFRAVTHNKGIMNGVDAVALALGQDWRSLEAAAHGFAAIGGYHPLATWKHEAGTLRGHISLPMPVGTVGGVTRTHRGVQTAFEIVRTEDPGELAIVMAAAGIASNLAALRALAGEGIQKGHMRLHARKDEAAAPARCEQGGAK